MARDHDDDVDVGRLESENLLRNKNTSKYLNDVVEQAALDHNEALEMIERERKMIASADQGFLTSLDLSTHNKLMERTSDRANRRTHDNDDESSIRAREVKSLLQASDQLLQLGHRAIHAVSEASDSSHNYASYEHARKEDQQRVKDILAAGKRVYEHDLGSLEKRSVEHLVRGDDDEITAQANAIFDGRRRKEVCESGDVGRSLKYMEKGVRKMTKGLDSDD